MNKYHVAGLALSVLLLAIVAGLLFWTKIETVQLVSRHWTADRFIEEFKTLNLDGWDETVPADAFDKDCRRRQRGSITTNDVSVPTYDDYCDYKVNRWARVETLSNNGGVADSVRIPEPTVRCAGVEEIGCQRYASYRITYRAIFQHGGTQFSCNYDAQTWGNLVEQENYPMVFGVIRGEPRCALGAV